ncbi:MAG: DUF4878 domain-containing protein [Bacteroidota bacterium]|nr:DUF4878 domain-containing protein [Bacteroidota bacterium]
MKKISSLFILAGTFLVLTSGCKGKEKVVNDPKAVVIAFFERMSKKDLDGAADLATKDSKSTIDLMKKAMEAAEKMGMDKDSAAKKDDPSEDFKQMVIGEAKIDGDNATVAVTNKAKDDKVVEFPLKKEGGQWKVDFSMGTLMKMGMDQASKNDKDGDDGFNSSDTADMSEKMKDFMNGDSLKKSLQDFDSLLKDIDPEKMKEMKEALKELEKLKQ